MPKLYLPAALIRPAAYATGLFAGKAVALLMLPVVANHLSVAQVGQLELYTSSSVFLSILLGMGLHEGLYRFAGQEQSAEKQAVIAGEIITLAAVIALYSLTALLGILFLTGTFVAGLPVHQLALLAVGVSSEGMIGLFLAWLRMQDRAADFVRVTLSVCLFQVSLVLLSLWIYPGVTGILAASVITHFLQLIWLWRLCRLKLQQPGRDKMKALFRYSLPISLAGLLAFLLNGAERWLIAATDSIEVLACYAIAGKFSLALCILVQPFGMWWMPKRFAVLAGQGNGEASRITQYGLAWIAIVCAFMAYFAPLFISLALPAGYQSAGQLVLLCLISAVAKEVTELVNLGLLAGKQTGLLLRFSLIAATTGITAAVILQSFAIWGIIAALILAQTVKLLLVYRTSQHLLALPYNLRPLLSLYLFTGLHLLLSALLSSWQLQLLLALIAPLSVLLLATLTGLLPCPKRLRRRIYQNLQPHTLTQRPRSNGINRQADTP
jgi:O-antigen/teichoic acid export membrane protein